MVSSRNDNHSTTGYSGQIPRRAKDEIDHFRVFIVQYRGGIGGRFCKPVTSSDVGFMIGDLVQAAAEAASR